MSLNLDADPSGTGPKWKPPILRTADQYELWKKRIGDACWSATGKDVLNLDDDDCETAMENVGDDREANMWVFRCWMIITASLHDDIYRKVSHVKRGMVVALLDEINHALVLTSAEEVKTIRLELYGSSMVKSCSSDLQAWINFVKERSAKLAFMGKPVEDDELVTIFLQGLQDTIFQPLQVYFAVPGNLPATLEDGATIVRRFAKHPAVAIEL